MKWMTAVRNYLGVATLLATAALLASPLDAQALLSNFKWTGAAPKGTTQWSSAENWEGAKAPAEKEKIGTLEFPALATPKCAPKSQETACYTSTNNVLGIEANELAIDDGVPYEISGNPISIGAGGITAAPSVGDCNFEELGCHPPSIALPVTLTAPQKWSITGGEKGQQLGLGEVKGESQSLTVELAGQPFLSLNRKVEVGPFTATGKGSIGLFPEFESEGSLNGTDAHTVNLSGGASLFVPFGANAIGPFTGKEASVNVGEGFAPDATLAANGSFSLDSKSRLTLYIDHAGTTPKEDYSQLTATGNVELGGATFELVLGTEFVGGKFPCAKLKTGDVDTLISTTGSLTGTFAGIPNGAEVPFSFCFGEFGTEEGRKVRINYTEHAVTATVLESPAEKKRHEEEAAAKRKAEEEAAAKRKAEEEAAAKRKAEEEAAAKRKAEEAAKRKAEEEAAAKKRAEEIAATSVKIVKVKVTARSVIVTILVTRAGTVTITGPGLKKTVVHLAAGTHKVSVPLTKLGKAERKQRKKIKITVRLTTIFTTVSRSGKVKL